MTKAEAIAAMKAGKKVTHPYFSKNEWMKMNGNIEIEFEDGVKMEFLDFWSIRNNTGWLNNFEIFKE